MIQQRSTLDANRTLDADLGESAPAGKRTLTEQLAQSRLGDPQPLSYPIERPAKDDPTRWDDLHFDLCGTAREPPPYPGAAGTDRLSVEHDAPPESPASARTRPGPRVRTVDGLIADLDRAAGELFEGQLNGVMTAEQNVASYDRQAPPVDDSLVRDVALLALTLATTGIIGGLASKVGALVVGALIGGEPSKPQVAFVSDALKDGLKRGVSYFTQGLSSGADGENTRSSGGNGVPAAMDKGASSSNPRIAYFSDLRRALITSSAARIAEVISSVDELVARAAEPEAVEAAIMDAIGELQAAVKDADTRQCQVAMTQWASLVAQSTLGQHWVRPMVGPDGASTAPGTATELGKAALDVPTATSDGVSLPKAKDGLLDLTFDLVSGDPRVHVVLRSARITGVAQECADAFEKVDLLTAGIPIRAYGSPAVDGERLIIPITVTRDEAGELHAAGDLDYLAWKGHSVNVNRQLAAEEQDALPGARILLEQELLATTLAAAGVPISTDDRTGTGDR